jgi:hypothetical protein
MERSVFIAAGLFVLSVVSGMLGLGVAFAAVPFLGLFMNDLVHEVQPLSLFLNGVTALFSAFGFARSRLVAWREALLLALVTTLFAPLGSWMAQFTAQSWLWGLYLLAVLYLAWRMFQPEKGNRPADSDTVTPRRFSLALLLAIPISILAGLLGVGPGFVDADADHRRFCTQASCGDQCSCRHTAVVLGACTAPFDHGDRHAPGCHPGRCGCNWSIHRRPAHQPIRLRSAAQAGVCRADCGGDGV